MFTPGDTNVHTETGAAIDNNIYIRILNQKDCIFLIFIITLHRALLLVLSPISALIFVQDPFRQCFDTANAFMLIHLFPFR